jgi:prophage regulatory protein
MTTYILRLHDVMLRTGLSRSTIYKYMSVGEFPKPVRLGSKAVGWRDRDIDEWIATRPVSPMGRPPPRRRRAIHRF